MLRAVYVAMFQLFVARRPQANDLDVEVQCLVSQGVVEIKGYTLRANVCHVGLKGPPRFVSHAECHAWFQGQIWRKNIVGDHFHRVRIPGTVAIGWRYHHIFLIANCHPIKRLLKAGDNLPLPLQKLQGFVIRSGVNQLSVCKTQSKIDADRQVIGNC